MLFEKNYKEKCTANRSQSIHSQDKTQFQQYQINPQSNFKLNNKHIITIFLLASYKVKDKK